MSDKIYYVYLTTNLINNKKYIGQHKGTLTDSYLGSGIVLTKAIQKYGKENFNKTILEICDEDTIDEREKYWIAYYNAVQNDDYYNQAEGGQGGDGWKACQTYLQQHRDIAEQLYKENGARIQQWLDNHPDIKQLNIQKMIDGSKKYYTDNPEKRAEVIQKMNKGKEKWQQEHPDEHQAQIDKWRAAGSEANSKKIICLNTREVFSSISEGARHYNTHESNISKVLRGERQSAGKHPITGEKLKWAYANE